MSCWYLLHLPSLHQLQPALNCPLKMIDWKEQIRVFKYLNLGIVQIFLQHEQENVNDHDNEQDPHTSSSKLSTSQHSYQHSISWPAQLEKYVDEIKLKLEKDVDRVRENYNLHLTQHPTHLIKCWERKLSCYHVYKVW